VLYGIEELIMRHTTIRSGPRVPCDTPGGSGVHQVDEGANFDIIENGGGDASSTVISPKIFDGFVAPYDAPLIALATMRAARCLSYMRGMMPFSNVSRNEARRDGDIHPVSMGGDTRLAEAKKRIGGKVTMIGGSTSSTSSEAARRRNARRGAPLL